MAKKDKKGYTHKVKSVPARTRISDYCGKIFPILGSKSATKKALAAGRILLNHKVAKTGDYVKAGDLIILKGSGIKAIKQFDIDLPVVYQDNHLIVVNKPGGIATNGNRFKTVENALAKTNLNNPEGDALPRPVAVHRIDLPTCGLIMLAKTKTALIKMGKAFQQNEVHKTYHALTHGKAPDQGKINSNIEGKKALTHFETIQHIPSRVFQQLSYLKLKPITGRTHQLRIHLKSIGHPITGDKMYADHIKTIHGKGLFLCACKMEFKHPITGKPTIVEIDFPNKFQRIMQREAERF